MPRPSSSLLGLGVILALAVPHKAKGESRSDDSVGLDELVVTAARQPRTLLRTPDAISVLSQSALEARRIQDLHDLAAIGPNVLVRSTFRTNETFPTLRGLSSAQGAAPAIAFVVDGVQVGASDFLLEDLVDLQQVEILRGPQGAIFGQSAIAGAINISTAAASPVPVGKLVLEAAQGPAYRARLMRSAPLGAGWSYRFNAFWRDDEGRIRNVRSQKIDFESNAGARLRLDYAGPKLDVTLKAAMSDGDGHCCIQNRALRQAGQRLDVDDVTATPATSNILGRETSRFADASARATWRGETFWVTSISSASVAKQSVFGDADFTAAPLRAQDLDFRTRVVNQDLRVSPAAIGQDLLVGVFAQSRRETQRVRVGREIADGVDPTLARQDLVRGGQLWAIYTQGQIVLAPKWSLMGALRYERDIERSRDDLNASATRTRARFSAWLPKLALTYAIKPNANLFFSYAEGFRPGGFSQLARFADERTGNFETGAKVAGRDGRWLVAGSIFRIDYKNQLLSYSLITATSAVRKTVNIPSTRIDGLEAEAWVALADHWRLNASLGLLDAEIRRVAPDPAIDTQGAVGARSPLAPRSTVTVAATYARSVGPFALEANLSGQRRGSYAFDLANTLIAEAATTLNASLSLSREAWRARLWVDNLTDARYAENISITGTDLRTPNAPRRYGLTIERAF